MRHTPQASLIESECLESGLLSEKVFRRANFTFEFVEEDVAAVIA